MKNLTATLVVALACTALQAQKPRTAVSAPQTSAERAVVLRGGKLLTITHGVIDDGVLVMAGGKIAGVGKASAVSRPIPLEAPVMMITLSRIARLISSIITIRVSSVCRLSQHSMTVVPFVAQ